MCCVYTGTMKFLTYVSLCTCVYVVCMCVCVCDMYAAYALLKVHCHSFRKTIANCGSFFMFVLYAHYETVH